MEQVAYFTLEDRKGKPKGVVCFLEINGTLAYGVSLCSLNDTFKIGRGRYTARERAKSAIFVDDYFFSNEVPISRAEAWKAMHDLCFYDFHRTNALTKNLIGTSDKCGILENNFDDAIYQFTQPVLNDLLEEEVEANHSACSCNSNLKGECFNYGC